jgi:choline transport protein
MPHTQAKSPKDGKATTDRASIKPGDLEEHDDDAILRANGHEAVMPRQFNWISALGLGFSITNSWIGYLVS